MDDPKNWTPFRAYFEAFKKIRQLVTGPHEQIPESLVRDFVAKRLGIKPDEVTWAQIRFEVAGLLPYYPAITLIPSEPLSTSESTDAVTYENERKAFVVPLLESKGWSILDWANEAGVAHATAIDFLANKTKPYRSTRLKLAKALGVNVEDLPR